MAISVQLHHQTTYAYDRLVRLTPHVIRLRPAPHSRTPVRAYSLNVSPRGHFLNWQQDPFGNHQARLVFPNETAALDIQVDLIADLTAINPFDFFVDEQAERFPLRYDAEQLVELAPYLHLTSEAPALVAFVEGLRRELCRPDRRTIDVLVDINQAITRRLRYDVRMEPGVFAPEETLTRGHGSCRDFAWLLAQVLRRLGVAARFVSGYSIQLRADVAPLEGPAGVTHDVTDLHAWAEAFVPGAGWIGFDPTSGMMCAEGHIPLACAADPRSAAPVTGGYLLPPGGQTVNAKLGFAMRVDRVREDPRVTLPYSDETWTAIDSVGRQVDAALSAGDVRLTMGGEPTFVSIDDPDGDEWNTTAQGPEKKRLAEALLHRLQPHFAPGGLLHHGQGKWYPGEPLPRWAMTCYFRKDGAPIWRRPELTARAGTPPPPDGAALAVAQTLARRLGVGERHVLPAYEDAFYYLWRERRLPANVDVSDAKLDDAIERARLARVFEQRLGSVAGYVLPLEHADGRWRSSHWPLRSDHLFLVPGDSPLGFRLPIDSLPWLPIEARPVSYAPDPFAPRPALPRPTAARATTPPEAPPVGPTVRTALGVQIRDGLLHVFLPPLDDLEAYLALVAEIEETAAAVAVPVRIEGYPPPRDPRLGQFAITPDPGVIEVNIQPARSWAELVSNTCTLYDEARTTRLGTDKFMVDGRHTGTGGGNHVVLGGPTAADSPLLRRPDLLRSLVGYFLNHPSLSYAFSGLFVGPTSQAPRIDEARQESVDELEIAFRQVDAITESASAAPPPWVVDRIFRDLLTDVTGNTHRTELCIDKLFSPDGAAGRQGLLELRGFEMPPHARMSLAQQLLLRALVAAFWRAPYRQPPVRWGTALHDRFALPHFVAADLDDVVADLRRAGFPFEAAWFAPHLAFRFPQVGATAVAGVGLELRQAIEPWHVLGEEAAGGGQSRFVDASLERLQIKVTGLTGDRHVVACNGYRIPLHPTGTSGEYVAGVRFRAWQPPRALHPRIGVHAPLTFDVVDTWSGRSLGGCTYHVAHPGGRAYETRPRNALEAEGRRMARFFTIGHTPGPRGDGFPRAVPTAPGFPLTLDLRRAQDQSNQR